MTETIERREVADEIVGPESKSTAVSVLDPLKKIEAGLVGLQADAAALAKVEPAGLDRAQRSFRMRCVKVRTDLDSAYETVNRPMLETQRQARALVADIKKAVEALEKPVDEAIQAREREREAERQRKIEAERQRVATIRDRIDSLRAVATRVVGKSAVEIEAKIQALVRAFDVDPQTLHAQFAEFLEQAQVAHTETLATLRDMHAAAVAQEAEAARLAAERAQIEAARREQEAEDSLVSGIQDAATRVEAETSGYLQKALIAFETVARDWAADPRPRVAHAVAAGRSQLAARLAAAQERERVAAEQAAEAQRLANERAAQEQADADARAARERADREAAEARAAEDRRAQEARDAEAARQRELIAAEQLRIDEANAELARRQAAAAPVEPAPAAAAQQVIEGEGDAHSPAGDPTPALKLGDLCDRFGEGFKVTAAFVAGMGVSGTKGERGATLYSAPEVTSFCDALIKRANEVKAGARAA